MNPRNERSRWGTNPWLTVRTQRSRWGTNPWLNPRSERSRWGTNPWLNTRTERSRWGTNPWLNPRNQRSRWGTNPWLNPRSERSRWGTNPWLNIQRVERSRWGTNPWLNGKNKKDSENLIEGNTSTEVEKEENMKHHIQGKENISKISNDVYTNQEEKEPKNKKGSSNYQDRWGLKLNFPVLNTYQNKEKKMEKLEWKMDEKIRKLKDLENNAEPISESKDIESEKIDTRSLDQHPSFRFQINPNSVLRHILEHFRILQRSRMTKRFVEPRVQPNSELKGPGITFWTSALQNNLGDMFDDKISVVRLKRNALFRSLFQTNEISKILKELQQNQ